MLVGLSTFGLAYHGAFVGALGAPVEAEHWFRDEMVLKRHLARNTPSPRLLLGGGSNVLFGLDSQLLAQAFGRPAVNLGLHAGLALDQVLDFASAEARSGDILVLSLEWQYLSHDYRHPSRWLADQVLAWNGAYFERLGLERRLRFIGSTSAVQLRDAWLAKLNAHRVLDDHPDRRPRSDREILARYAAMPPLDVFSYHYRNTDRHGDMQNTCDGTLAELPSVGSYLDGSTVPPVVPAYLADTVQRLAGRNVRTFIVFPPVVREADVGGHLLEGMHALTTAMLDHGLPVLGTPEGAMLPASMFFNSQYHLNCEGRRARTRAVAELVAAALGARSR